MVFRFERFFSDEKKAVVESINAPFQLVHPFEEPFGDDKGPSVMSQFTFKQKSTNVAQFLEVSVEMMKQQRFFFFFGLLFFSF